MTSATAAKRKAAGKSGSTKAVPAAKKVALAGKTAKPAAKRATPVPRKATPVPRKITSVPKKITSVPKKITSVPKKTAPVPRKSAREALKRSAVGDAAAIVRSLAGISTAAVAKATGHGWNYWLRALDKAGAMSLPHREIVKLLSSNLGLRTPWWLQMVAVGYEQARGLRKPNQKPDGFVASVSRTVAVPINALYAAWQEGKRGDWLPDAVEVRRATKNKSMKITWPDGSGIDVNFYDKGGNKAVVAIEAAKLPDPGAVAAVKYLWGSTLDRLKATLEGKS